MEKNTKKPIILSDEIGKGDWQWLKSSNSNEWIPKIFAIIFLNLLEFIFCFVICILYLRNKRSM